MTDTSLAALAAKAMQWQDIASAPLNTPVRVSVGESMTFAARLVPNASVNSEEQSCYQWKAAQKGVTRDYVEDEQPFYAEDNKAWQLGWDDYHNEQRPQP